VVAADAGAMGIEWIGGTVWKSAESVERSRTENVEGEIVVGEVYLGRTDRYSEKKRDRNRNSSAPGARNSCLSNASSAAEPATDI